MTPRSPGSVLTLLGACAVAWFAGAASRREPVRAAEPAAAASLRHQFINNLDTRRQPPNERGYVSISFKQPLPTTPTILLQCANPRYAAKVHGATAAGFLFAIYRTRDAMQAGGNNPFEGKNAAKPVTDFREADNIDIAWVALAE